jgi:hypothetical protein
MDSEPAPKTSFKSRGPYVVLIVGILLAALGVGLFLFFPRELPLPVVPDAGPPIIVDAGPPPEPAVDIAKGNDLAEEAAKGIVPDAWLQGGDAIRRLAAAVNAVSEGQSPRVILTVLEPDGTFIVDEKKPKKRREHSKYFISAKNGARYDKVTKLVTSIDAQAVGQRYRQLRPYLEAAYREISRPGKTFDGAFTKAVDLLAAVPISDAPQEVVPMRQGTGYAYVDPKLEALSPAEKHLLRMGPKNARALVKQLQAFRAAMNEPAP